MVRLVKEKEADKKKAGRPPELIIEDRVLMVIQYGREYRSYDHIGLDISTVDNLLLIGKIGE